MKLGVNRCPQHGVLMISIDDADGHGVRVTPSKCCGAWRTIRSWKLSADEWDELGDRCREAAEESRK